MSCDAWIMPYGGPKADVKMYLKGMNEVACTWLDWCTWHEDLLCGSSSNLWLQIDIPSVSEGPGREICLLLVIPPRSSCQLPYPLSCCAVSNYSLGTWSAIDLPQPLPPPQLHFCQSFLSTKAPSPALDRGGIPLNVWQDHGLKDFLLGCFNFWWC